jgi:hypothetical protein
MMSKIKFLTEKYGITCLSNDNLELFISEIYNDGYQAGKDKSELRDHFAGLAMQTLPKNIPEMETLARMSYVMADAMIAERNKHHKERHQELLCQGEICQPNG